MLQIDKHPVLGDCNKEEINFYFEEKPLVAKKGQKISSALMANQIYEFSRSRKLNQARGVYCASGRCMTCYVTIEDRHNIRACRVKVTEGMRVYKTFGNLES